MERYGRREEFLVSASGGPTQLRPLGASFFEEFCQANHLTLGPSNAASVPIRAFWRYPIIGNYYGHATRGEGFVEPYG